MAMIRTVSKGKHDNGNPCRWWRKRTTQLTDKKVGPALRFPTPDILWVACEEYFTWVQDTPLYESKPFVVQGEVILQAIPKMRPFTLTGLCIFLEIVIDTWINYKTRNVEFNLLCNFVEQIIYTQKFEGAVADLMNANLIARDLKLRDSHEMTGPDGGPLKIDIGQKIDVSKLSDTELTTLITILDKAQGQKD